MSGIIVIFIMYMIWVLVKALLPIYIEKEREQINLYKKTGETLDTIRLSCETSIAEVKKVNDNIVVVKAMIDDVGDSIDDLPGKIKGV